MYWFKGFPIYNTMTLIMGSRSPIHSKLGLSQMYIYVSLAAIKSIAQENLILVNISYIYALL